MTHIRQVQPSPQDPNSPFYKHNHDFFAKTERDAFQCSDLTADIQITRDTGNSAVRCCCKDSPDLGCSPRGKLLQSPCESCLPRCVGGQYAHRCRVLQRLSQGWYIQPHRSTKLGLFSPSPRGAFFPQLTPKTCRGKEMLSVSSQSTAQI